MNIDLSQLITAEHKVEKATKELADSKARNIDKLWQAAHDYEYQYISGMAIGVLTLGVLNQLPKSLAIKQWSNSIWALYYQRKPLVTAILDEALLDFSTIGSIPYSVPALLTEVTI